MARNIQDVVKLFLAGKPASAGNCNTDGKSYFLFGNRIAYKGTDGRLHFNWCGYYTVSTARHMNAIIEEAYGYGQRVSYAKDRDAGVKEFVR